MTMIAGSEFQLRLTILSFCIKFDQNRYLLFKIQKVHIVIQFCMFKRGYNHGHNILRLFDV